MQINHSQIATKNTTAATNALPSLKDGAALVGCVVKGSSGAATISAARALIEGHQVESKLVKGTKVEWFPSAELSFVNTASKAVSRALEEEGVSFGKGLTMVPLNRLSSVTGKLKMIQDKFEEDLQSSVDRYDSIIKKHMDENPEVSALIEGYKLSPEAFKDRFIFRPMPAISVMPIYEEEEGALRESLTSKLYEEISSTAFNVYKNSFQGKESCTQRAINVVRKIHHKLVNLSFIDEGIDRVATSFEKALASVPKGKVEGGEFFAISHYLSVVSDEEYLLALAAGDTSTENDLDEDDLTEAPAEEETTESAMSEEQVEEDLEENVPEEVESDDTDEVDEQTEAKAEDLFVDGALFDEEIDTSDEFNQDDLDIESTISQVSDQETVTTLVDEPNLLETESTDPFGDFDFGTF